MDDGTPIKQPTDNTAEYIAPPRTLPGDTGAAVPLPEWATPWERWAWDRISLGEFADMSMFPAKQYAENGFDIPDADKVPVLDPIVREEGSHSKPMLDEDGNTIEVPAEDWPAWQTLSRQFLELILLNPHWRDSQAKRGVYLWCARLVERLRLNGQELLGDFCLDMSRIEAELSMQTVSLGGILSLQSSLMMEGLGADRLKTEGGVLLRSGAVFKKDVRLLGATIGGDLSCNESIFEQNCFADGAQIHGGIFLRSDATFHGDVRLLGTHVGDALACIGGKFKGKLNADRCQIGGSVFLREGAVFEGRVDFESARISGDLQIYASTFHDCLRLRGTEVKGEIRMNETLYRFAPPTWKPGARLDFQNATVGALHGTLQAWRTGDNNDGPFVPRDLSGMTFTRAKGGVGGSSLEDEKPKDLVKWLEDDLSDPGGLKPGFSPSPYQSLAAALETHGHASTARHVRYALSEAERRNAKGFFNKRMKGMSKAIIGHGYKVERSFWWLLALILIPAWVGHMTEFNWEFTSPTLESVNNFMSWTRYSTENAMPNILTGSDPDSFLAGNVPPNFLEGAKWIALVQRLLTTLILGFIVAALTGWARQRGE